MTQEIASTVLVLELLESILSAPGLSGGFALLFDKLLPGSRRAVALAERRGALHGVVGRGVPEAAVRALSVPLHGDTPLARAFQGGESVARVAEGPDVAGLFPFALLPLRAPDGRLFAALVVDDAEDEEAERLAALLPRVAPALLALHERERLGEARAGAERRLGVLKGICDALSDPVLVAGPRHDIVLDNHRARELFRAGEGDGLEGRRRVEINHHLLSSFLARFPAGDGSEAELSLVEPATGDDLRFEVAASPLAPEVAEPGSTVFLLRDVTALKRASNALEHQFLKARRAEARSRRERDRLDLILANVGAPILVTDDRSAVVLMNREAARLFETPPGMEASAAGAEAEGNGARFSGMVSDFARSGDAARVAELRLVDPETGAAFPARIVSGKITDEHGALLAVVSVCHDQSREVENARLAAELARANEGLEDRVREATLELEERNRRLEWQQHELERAYRLKSEFLASMSHELRTPINALLGYASLMRDRVYGDLTSRQEEALARMNRASEHLLELVNDILDLAKIEAGKMPVHVEPVAVPELLGELADAVEPLVRRKHLRFEVETRGELPVVETDRTRVKQIVLNLLSNAVKFTHAGEVRLRAWPVEGGIEISVSDTGIGIAAHHLETIWDDFRQVDQSSTREYGGTGLGLSIVRKLLALLGGSVRVESEVGKGSVFIVTLPLRTQPFPEGEEAARAANLAPPPGTLPGGGA